jgi:hypothetical protein
LVKSRGDSADQSHEIAIRSHTVIRSQQSQFLNTRLRHQHAVERIAMMPRRGGDFTGLRTGKRQTLEGLLSDPLLEICGYSQFA